MSILTKIIGDPNEKFLKKLQPLVKEINELEEKFKPFSDEEIKNQITKLKQEVKNGKSLEDILPEVFALVREAAKRTLNQRHYDVQLIGGIVLHQGRIAEMKTGEGKTLTSTLAICLNALAGKGVHLITVNDYLTRRDLVWMGQIYNFLGLSAACIIHEAAYIYDSEYKKPEIDKERDLKGGFKVFSEYLRPCSRKEAYEADILYGTNNEFGFDYLRDNMVQFLNQRVQRGHSFAIIDEVDSVLIDEARTPLIISAPDTESPKLYEQFASVVPQLKETVDYEIDEKTKSVTLTNAGIDKVESILKIENIYGAKEVHYVRYLEQSLKAYALFKKDKDYVVKPSADGGEVLIVDEFTGRLMPGRRWSDGLHQAVEAKERVPVKEESKTLATITFQNYFKMYQKLSGMTGTAITSAEEFDSVYKLDIVVIPTNKPLIRQSLPDRIYKNEKGKFKAIIKEVRERNKKGQPVLIGTISIEKNEILGLMLRKEGIHCEILNAKQHEKEGTIIAQAGKKEAVTVATNMSGRGVDIILGGNPPKPEEAKKVKELGGLHVIGTERHDARRIDNQLRGRSGRQGDPGSSQFFVSLEDEIMKRFGSERVQKVMETFGLPDDQPIENKFISNAIEKAQSRIEGHNFDARKHVLEYDNVMSKHREKIYNHRLEILKASDEEMKRNVEKLLTEKELKEYQVKKERTGDSTMKFEKFIMLNTIDMFWVAHLDNMSHLRDSVGLRAYGNRDPLVEYKNEGHQLFIKLLKDIDNGIIETLLKVEFRKPPAPVEQKVGLSTKDQRVKVGRNDPCPCGSGKKYKKCCGK